MYQAFQVSTTFGVNAPPNMSVEGFADIANPHIPSRKDYLFRKDHLRDVLAFLSAPKGDGLYITGPPVPARLRSSSRSPPGSTGRCRPSPATAGWNSTTCSGNGCCSKAAGWNGPMVL